MFLGLGLGTEDGVTMSTLFSVRVALGVQGVRLAKKFETLVQSDRRFEVPAKRHLGMVVFRLKVTQQLAQKLIQK